MAFAPSMWAVEPSAETEADVWNTIKWVVSEMRSEGERSTRDGEMWRALAAAGLRPSCAVLMVAGMKRRLFPLRRRAFQLDHSYEECVETDVEPEARLG